MNYTKYYIGYTISLLIILGVWMGPTLLNEKKGEFTDMVLTERITDITIKEKTEERIDPKEDKKIWNILNNIDIITSLIVGIVNIRLVVSHHRKKRKEKKIINKPKRIKRIFDPKPFD